MFLEGIVRVNAYAPTFVAWQRLKVSVENKRSFKVFAAGIRG